VPAPLPQEPPLGNSPSYVMPMPMSPAGAIRPVSPRGFTPRPGSIVQQVSELPLGFVASPRPPMAAMTPGGTPRQVSELPPGFVASPRVPTTTMTPGGTLRQVSALPLGFVPTGPTVPVTSGMNTPRNSSQLLRPLSRASTVGRRTPVGNRPGALADDFYSSQPGSSGSGGGSRTVGFNAPDSPSTNPIRRTTTPHPLRDGRHPLSDSDSSASSGDPLTTPPDRGPRIGFPSPRIPAADGW
jgi:hypothetical protein